MLMPNVVGQNYNEAVLTLTDAGVYVAVPSYAFLPEQITVEWAKVGGTGGIVQTQVPVAGANVAASVPITLTVSEFPMSATIGP